MKVSWRVEDNSAVVDLSPETLMDKAVLDGLTGVTTATVSKNGTLKFVMEVPRQSINKPLIERGKDDVRDNNG